MTETPGEAREGRLVASVPADTFGHRLILVRAHLGHMTIQQAAERTGLNYGSWSNWERGKTPREIVEVVAAISENLGIDRDWLLHGGPLTPAPRRRNVLNGRYVRSITRPRETRISSTDSRLRRPRRIDRMIAA